MVRAGVVSHPREWEYSGYFEIQNPRKRYAIIDLEALTALCGFGDWGDFQRAHCEWLEQAGLNERAARENRWSEATAVGGLAFVESVKNELGSKAMHRAVEQIDGAYTLREQGEAYDGNLPGEIEPLRPGNTVLWDQSVGTVES